MPNKEQQNPVEEVILLYTILKTSADKTNLITFPGLFFITTVIKKFVREFVRRG